MAKLNVYKIACALIMLASSHSALSSLLACVQIDVSRDICEFTVSGTHFEFSSSSYNGVFLMVKQREGDAVSDLARRIIEKIANLRVNSIVLPGHIDKQIPHTFIADISVDGQILFQVNYELDDGLDNINYSVIEKEGWPKKLSAYVTEISNNFMVKLMYEERSCYEEATAGVGFMETT